MATRRTAGKGGARLGSGRPAGPPEEVRRNRVTFTLTDADLERLRRLAVKRKLPVGTLAFEVVQRWLCRTK